MPEFSKSMTAQNDDKRRTYKLISVQTSNPQPKKKQRRVDSFTQHNRD